MKKLISVIVVIVIIFVSMAVPANAIFNNRTHISTIIIRQDFHLIHRLYIPNNIRYVINGNLYLPYPELLYLNGRIIVLGNIVGEWRNVNGRNSWMLHPTWQALLFPFGTILNAVIMQS